MVAVTWPVSVFAGGVTTAGRVDVGAVGGSDPLHADTSSANRNAATCLVRTRSCTRVGRLR